MNKIDKIREMINTALPDRDKSIANKFLDERKFDELKEIVDSDVFKAARKKVQLSPVIDENGNILEEPSKECIEAEEIYDKLKELQSEVNAQTSLSLIQEPSYTSDYYDFY